MWIRKLFLRYKHSRTKQHSCSLGRFTLKIEGTIMGMARVTEV